MYIQCMGYYIATPTYSLLNRADLNSYLLLYTVSGCGYIEYCGRKEKLLPSSAVLIHCTKLHSYYSDSAQSSNWSFYWIHFGGDCALGYFEELFEDWRARIIPDLVPLIETAVQIMKETPANYDVVCSDTLLAIASKLLLSARESSRGGGADVSPVVKASIAYMEENYQSKISLDALCASLHISKYHYSRMFKRETGCSPYEYLVNYRITQAKYLLRHTDLSIAEIAAQTCFDSSSYFIKTFKRREGLTPLQFKKYFLESLEGPIR